MKKIFIRTLLVLAIFMAVSQVSSAQGVFVKVQPFAGVEVRTAAPSPRHVWVGGEWAWKGSSYERQPGYWVVPEPHRQWVPGHWRRAYGGWNWAPGHWRRVE